MVTKITYVPCSKQHEITASLKQKNKNLLTVETHKPTWFYILLHGIPFKTFQHKTNNFFREYPKHCHKNWYSYSRLCHSSPIIGSGVSSHTSFWAYRQKPQGASTAPKQGLVTPTCPLSQLILLSPAPIGSWFSANRNLLYSQSKAKQVQRKLM